MSDAVSERFWSFSCAFYGEEGVAPLCLDLQDRCGWDVNLALFGLWLASEARALDARALERAARWASAWREEMVEPLRALRRSMKAAAAEDPDKAKLYAQLKAAELEAEHVQQNTLAAMAPTGRSDAAFVEQACAHLDALSAAQECAPPAENPQLQELIACAARFVAARP